MSTQKQDDTFTEIKPFDEALEEFKELCEEDEAKAFHTGNYEELMERLRRMGKDKFNILNSK